MAQTDFTVSGTTGVTSVATSGLATGGTITGTGTITVSAATKAQQEAASSSTVAVTPSNQQYHPSAIQAWVWCGSTGTIIASYNTTSVTNSSTGVYTSAWTTSFTSTAVGNFATISYPFLGSAASTLIGATQSIGTGGFTVSVVNASTYAYTSPSGVSMSANGAQ